MLTLRPETWDQTSLPLSTAWLLASCAEAKGREDLWTRQRPETLAALREQAIIQSVESSNRIEGVTVRAERLRPIALGTARPRDRSEEELAGYRRALAWVFARKHPLDLQPRVLQHLHALMHGGFSADAGRWKTKDNEILEILPSGGRRLRFRPTSAAETPRAVEHLCASFRDACGQENLPQLLVASTFVFDLLCIHPFRDGNGRVSRLIATLLLLQLGFGVGRYISLERLVEESKEDYYRVLGGCSAGWHEGKNEIVPWWNYFLGVLRRAYGELERRVESAEARPGKSELIRRSILDQVGPFTLADVRAQTPSASSQMIKKVLARMKVAGEVHLTGRGRGARWELRS